MEVEGAVATRAGVGTSGLVSTSLSVTAISNSADIGAAPAGKALTLLPDRGAGGRPCGL